MCSKDLILALLLLFFFFKELLSISFYCGKIFITTFTISITFKCIVYSCIKDIHTFCIDFNFLYWYFSD